jgi:hypothetical protein
MIPFAKRFLLFKVVFSLFLVISIPILFPQVSSQSVKSYFSTINKEKEKFDSLYQLKESNLFKKLNQYEGIFDWIIMILQFILTIIQKLIVFISEAIQLVFLLERVIDAIQALIDVINQLIQAISDLFNPELQTVF